MLIFLQRNTYDYNDVRCVFYGNIVRSLITVVIETNVENATVLWVTFSKDRVSQFYMWKVQGITGRSQHESLHLLRIHNDTNLANNPLLQASLLYSS